MLCAQIVLGRVGDSMVKLYEDGIYLRGGSDYELLWTEEPFKMTSLPTGNDFFVCKASDVYRPIAHLCRTCGKIVLDIKK